MTNLAIEPAITLQPAESRQRFSPFDHANLALVKLVIKLSEFLEKERAKNLAELDSLGESRKHKAKVLGAKATAWTIANRTGTQELVATIIRASEA